MPDCKTTYIEDALDQETADNLFGNLLTNVEWEEGVRSKNGFTRKAKALPLDCDEAQLLQVYINDLLLKLRPKNVEAYAIVGIYLNLYEDGNMYTPNHNHPKQHQLVISLGAERILNIEKREFRMKHGSAIIFGSSIHGVPKQPEVKDTRISIAVFMVPLSSD